MPDLSSASGSPSPDGDPFDYGADADPDQEAVARAFVELDLLTLQAERAQVDLQRAEETAALCKQKVDDLLMKKIPDLLDRMRLSCCVTRSGISVTVRREIRASLPGKDRGDARSAALRWLVDQGHGGVVKNNVAISLDRGDDARADALVVELRSRGLEVDARKDVHASTLGALVRELVANGKIVPRGLFNIFDDRVAKLSRK